MRLARTANLAPSTMRKLARSYTKSKPVPLPKASPITLIFVDQRVWAKAMQLAKGDHTRIKRTSSPEAVIVTNPPITHEKAAYSMPKNRVTYKKYEGDDSLSYAVFVDGVPVEGLTGLNISQARYYRQQVIDRVNERCSRR